MQQVGPVKVQAITDSSFDLVRTLDTTARNPKGRRQLQKVRVIGQVNLAVAVAVKGFCLLRNHARDRVVEDDLFNGRPVGLEGRQLRPVKQEGPAAPAV